MTDGARQCFWSLAVIIREFVGMQTPGSPGVDDDTFVADEHRAIGAHFLAVGNLLGTWWAEAAIIPNEFECGHVAARRKFVSDHGGERIGFVDRKSTRLNSSH